MLSAKQLFPLCHHPLSLHAQNVLTEGVEAGMWLLNAGNLLSLKNTMAKLNSLQLPNNMPGTTPSPPLPAHLAPVLDPFTSSQHFDHFSQDAVTAFEADSEALDISWDSTPETFLYFQMHTGVYLPHTAFSLSLV